MWLRRRIEEFSMLQPANKSDRMCHMVAMTMRSPARLADCMCSVRLSNVVILTRSSLLARPGVWRV